MISSLLWMTASLVTAADPAPPCLLLITGAAGTEEYAEHFNQWAGRWEQAARASGIQVKRIGADENRTDDRQQLKTYLNQLPRQAVTPLWIVLIGHGTYADKQAKFNLHGLDVTATEFSQWLEPLQRPVAIVNCASSSSPFINRLSRQDRVIVTATKSGFENNYARLGDYLSRTISDPTADLDKDGQVSLLESFILASSQVEEFYRQNGRLATEHALIDDNGDSLGTPANWFRGVIGQQKAQGANQLDGLQANQFHLIRSPEEKKLTAEMRKQRNDLERQLTALREKKGAIDTGEYFKRLERICLELAQIYQQVEQQGKGNEPR